MRLFWWVLVYWVESLLGGCIGDFGGLMFVFRFM